MKQSCIWLILLGFLGISLVRHVLFLNFARAQDTVPSPPTRDSREKKNLKLNREYLEDILCEVSSYTSLILLTST